VKLISNSVRETLQLEAHTSIRKVAEEHTKKQQQKTARIRVESKVYTVIWTTWIDGRLLYEIGKIYFLKVHCIKVLFGQIIVMKTNEHLAVIQLQLEKK